MARPARATNGGGRAGALPDRLFRASVEAIGEAIVLVDQDQTIVYLNPKAVELFGYDGTGPIGRPLTCLLPQRFRETHPAHFKRFKLAPDNARPMSGRPDLAALRSDGSEFPVEITISKCAVDGVPLFSAVVRDVTERVQADLEFQSYFEEAFSAVGEQFFARLVRHLGGALDAGIAFVGELVAGGSVVQTLAVLARGEIVENFRYGLAGTPCADAVVSGSRFYPTGVQRRFPSFRIRSVGEIESYRGAALRNAAGETIGLIVAMNEGAKANSTRADTVMRIFGARAAAEIERRQDEFVLRENAQIFSQFVDNVQEVFWMTDPEKSQMLYISPGYEGIWGRSCQNLLESPRSWLDAIHPDDRERVIQAAVTRQVLGTYDEEYRIVRPDGSLRVIRDKAFPIYNPSGRVYRVAGVAKDITAQKMAEAHSAQSQKLEAIGQLAAGIAHEINTPTQFVGDNLRFLKDAFNDLAELIGCYNKGCEAAKAGGITPELIAKIEAAAKAADLGYLQTEIPKAIAQGLDGTTRIAEIVRAMKEFSHPSGKEKAAVDLNRALTNTATVARSEWKYVADLELKLDPGLAPVVCYPDALNQVFLNIIVNAAHAIEAVVGKDSGKKGRITVATRADGDWAEVRIADTGAGIPEKIREKVYDPFFTTKGVGKGTGQGLAIAHAIIVDRHQGTIRFESHDGQGTTFIIRLPQASAEGGDPR